MKRLVIILRRTLTRCYGPPTIPASGWASGLRSIPSRSMIRPVCISHIAHTAIGHTPIGTGSTVHIIGTGARQPTGYYGMLKSLPRLACGIHQTLPWGTRKNSPASLLGCSLNANADFQPFPLRSSEGHVCALSLTNSSLCPRNLSRPTW